MIRYYKRYWFITCMLLFEILFFCKKSALEDFEIKTIDWSQAREALILSGHTDEVTGVIFNEDGRYLITLSKDRTARIWDAETGKEITVLTGHALPVRCGVFIDSSSQVKTFADDRTIKLWNAKSGEEINSIPVHCDEKRIFSAAFSPDGSLLVLGFEGRSLVYDADTGEQIMELAPSGHPGLRAGIMDIGFSTDGHRIITAAYSQEVAVWSSESGHRLLNLHEHGQGCLTAAFSADMTRFASGSRDSTVIIWDARLGTILKKMHVGHEVRSVLFSPDGATLLIFEAAPRGQTSRAALYDLASSSQLISFKGAANLERASFSPTGIRFAAPFDSTVKIFQADTTAESVPMKLKMDSMAALSLPSREDAITLRQIKEIVKKAVDGPSEYVRLRASQKLAKLAIAHDDILPLLNESLQSKDSGIQKNAALTLAEMGVPALAANSELVNLLKNNPNAEVRTAAALALGCIAQATDQAVAVGELENGLYDRDVRVRYHTAHALDKMYDKIHDALPALTQVVLTDSSTGLRRQIAFNLGNAGMASIDALPRLIQGLTSNDQRERWWACYTLWCISANVGQAAKSAMPALKKVLFDSSDFRDKNGGPPRKYAIYAMGGIGPIVKKTDPEIITILKDIMVNDDDYYHRKAAAISLQNILQVEGLRQKVRGYVKRTLN